MLERELKLVIGPEADTTDLGEVLTGACRRTVKGSSLGHPTEQTIDDRYHDTADLRLARWGCTLRYRSGEGWTAKLPVPGTGPTLARREVVVAGPAGPPPADAVALIRPLTRGEPLVEVARLATTRTTWRWTGTDGDAIGEICDDRIVAVTDTGDSAWRELELEFAPEVDDEVAERTARRLTRRITNALAAGAVAPTDRPKLVRAIGPAAEAAADVTRDLRPGDPSAAEVVRAAIARSVAHLLAHLPAARLGTDPEAVHQARVATRRLRSDLRTFGPLLDAGWAAALSNELRWLADDLGAVRDADVLLGRIEALVADRPDLAGPGTERVVSSLRRRRARARRELLVALDREEADRLVDHLVGAAAEPQVVAAATGPAAETIEPLVARRWRRLTKAADRLGDSGGEAGFDPVEHDDELHRLRLLTKRARSAAAAAVPVHGRRVRRLSRALGRLQDTLGELNDATAAEAALATLAGRAKGETAFAAGRLAEAITAEAAVARAGWPDDLARARRRAAEVAWLQ